MAGADAADTIRDLTDDDLAWVLDLGAARRARLVTHAPRFWNPAPDARSRHREFLLAKILDPSALAIRTEHGFLFADPRGEVLDVDDLVLDDEARWQVDGAVLLRRAGGRGPLRVVCPVPERARRAAAEGLGLRLQETWWTKELPRGRPADAAPSGTPLERGGARGTFVAAPPIYDPGGPVLLVHGIGTGSDLDDLEQGAADAGARVSVVPQAATDAELARLLTAGYTRTTDFLGGTVR